MLRLTTVDEISFIALCLEGFFYGVYSGIFAMYLQYQASRKDSGTTQKIIFSSMCSLYIISVAVFACDIAICIYELLGKPLDALIRVVFTQTTSFGCCDFIAQFILIYRCWIVWGCNIRVVIIPSILAFAFLVIWLVGGTSSYVLSDKLVTPHWGNPMTVTSLAMSLTVNALVTGLIVFRIFKVFREVNASSDGQILAATDGSKLRRTVMVLIESGMALFSIQLARVVVTVVWTDAAKRAFVPIAAIHQMLNGITPTIILVRTSMGLSFHDEKSMEEVAVGSLRFACNDPNSVSEMGSIGIVVKGSSKADDDIDLQRSNDIDIVVG